MSARAGWSRALVALVIVVGLGAQARPAAAQAVYRLGAGAEVGNAYLPPTAGAGLTTSLSYREHGGLLGNILMVIAEAPARPSSTSTTTYETSCVGAVGDQTCTLYETTVTMPPSAAAVEAWERDMAAWGPSRGAAILRGELGQELQIDIPLRALGGSTTGVMLRLYRPIGSSGHLSVGQFALGWLTFHDVTTREVMATATELRATDKVADHTYKYVGLPVRVQAPIGRTGFGVHAQLDLNVLSIVTDDPSPVRAGVQWVGPHVIVTVDGVASGLRLDAGSIAAEVTLAL